MKNRAGACFEQKKNVVFRLIDSAAEMMDLHLSISRSARFASSGTVVSYSSFSVGPKRAHGVSADAHHAHFHLQESVPWHHVLYSKLVMISVDNRVV